MFYQLFIFSITFLIQKNISFIKFNKCKDKKEKMDKNNFIPKKQTMLNFWSVLAKIIILVNVTKNYENNNIS